MLVPKPQQGLFSPLNSDPYTPDGIPILHGNPYAPPVTAGEPNCQPGQTGYVLGQDLIPGQGKDNPTFGVSQIAGPGSASGQPALGKTDLFLEQDGTRLFGHGAGD